MARSQFPISRPRKDSSKPKRRVTRLQTHVMQWGGQYTHDQVPICDGCGMRRDHRVHDLTQLIDEDIADDVREIDERRGGE